VADSEDFYVRFWGVRGSIATPGPRTARYGGNTSSLEVRCGKHMFLFDAGTGLRYLGNELVNNGAVDTDLFLTHTHFDHVCGLPFFVPLFIKTSQIRIWAGHLKSREMTVKYVISEMMFSPLFPVPPEIFTANVSYLDFDAGEVLEPRPGVKVRTTRLNHPDRATGYRVEFGGKSICYLTDTQHVIGKPDQNVLNIIKGADMVIYDSTYTDAEFPKRADWGHSTWEEGVRLCEAAGVKTFVVFHHDPDHDDDFMDKVTSEVTAKRPGSIVAKEGLVLQP
jgi:phosphoribosyl 1,2-cyclic phosphodiesterase